MGKGLRGFVDDALARTGPLAVEKSGDFPTARPFAHKLHRALFGSDKIPEGQNQPHHRSTDRNRQGSTYRRAFAVQTSGATSVSRNAAKLKVADKALDTLKDRVREPTRRTRGTTVAAVVAEPGEAPPGWKAHFGIAEVLSPLRDLDKWVRRRFRCHLWKAMRASGLSGTAQTWRVCACSVACQQVRTPSMAGVADAGPVDRAPVALLRKNGTPDPCAAAGIQFIEPPAT
jgi:hypothetical protein